MADLLTAAGLLTSPIITIGVIIPSPACVDIYEIAFADSKSGGSEVSELGVTCSAINGKAKTTNKARVPKKMRLGARIISAANRSVSDPGVFPKRSNP